MKATLIHRGGIVLAGCLIIPTLLEARSYDPKTGRFLQRDPKTSGQVRVKKNQVQVDKPTPPTTNPLDANPYTYVDNNPVNFVDPFGERSVAPGVGHGFTAPPIPGGLVRLPEPSTCKKGKECPAAQVAEEPEEDEGKEVVCNLVDQSETVCQYRCSDGSFVNLNRKRIPNEACPPVIVHRR